MDGSDPDLKNWPYRAACLESTLQGLLDGHDALARAKNAYARREAESVLRLRRTLARGLLEQIKACDQRVRRVALPAVGER